MRAELQPNHNYRIATSEIFMTHLLQKVKIRDNHCAVSAILEIGNAIAVFSRFSECRMAKNNGIFVQAASREMRFRYFKGAFLVVAERRNDKTRHKPNGYNS